ncbi:unnamed protein product [Scytosiphon promiscuus]
MFHAVNQMAGEDLLSPGNGALPMFREEQSSSYGRGSRNSRSGARSGRRSSRRAQEIGGAGDSNPAVSASVDAAEPTPTVSGGAAPTELEMRPLHPGGVAAPRRRRSGQLREISGGRAAATVAAASKSSPVSAAAAFSGPDGVDGGGFAEAGTFRWDATVADAATAQQDGLGEDGLEQEEVAGSGGVGRRRRGRVGGGGGGEGGSGGNRRGGMGMRRNGKLALSPPMSGDMADIALAARYRKPWYIITPESKTHQILDHIGDFLTLYVLVAIPLFVSFQHIENMHAEDWHAFNFVVDVCFLLDLAARFLTAYHDEYADRIVYEPLSIARNYSRGLLVFDLIASVPLTILLGVHTFSISNKVTRLARMPQTMRLIRAIKVLSEEAEKTHRKNILLAAYNLVKVVLYILLVMHWVACGWHLLADLEDADLSWIVKDGLEDAPASQLYVTSVYWTVTTLSTVGYGDIFASTIAERTYCILVMLTGATMYALAIGAVSHIITTVVARHSHSRRIERHAETFIRMHSLPQYLASEVMRTLNISGETNQMLEKRAQNTLELLPTGVRTSVLLCIYRAQISRIDFFKNRKDIYPVFVTSVMRSMHDHVYPKAGEDVLQENSSTEEVIFIVRGRATITRRGMEVGRLSAGSCFGATAALHGGGLRTESVTCVTDCEIYTIEGKALRRIARSFPGPMAELKAESERPLRTGEQRRESDGSELRKQISNPSQGSLPRDAGSSTLAALHDTVGGTVGHPLPSPQRAARSASTPADHPVPGDPGMTALPTAELERSMQALTRCNAQASRAEEEVWDRLHLLTESLRTMRRCINEGRDVHNQVLDSMDIARGGLIGERRQSGDSRLVDSGRMPSAHVL